MWITSPPNKVSELFSVTGFQAYSNCCQVHHLVLDSKLSTKAENSPFKE